LLIPVWWESPKERDFSEDQGVDGRMGNIIDIREIGWGGRVDPVGSEWVQWRLL
jgi:hypothetical protein